MIQLTIGSTSCTARVKETPFEDYGPEVEIDLQKFLYSFKTEQNFMADIPQGYYKMVETLDDKIYIWQVIHNTNSIITFPFQSGHSLNLYVPYLNFKWELKAEDQGYKIINSWLSICHANPFETPDPDTYHFGFTNIYGDERICWGSHRLEGTLIPDLKQLNRYSSIFINEARNNDMVGWSNLADYHQSPDSDGLFQHYSLDDWRSNNNFVGGRITNFWSGSN